MGLLREPPYRVNVTQSAARNIDRSIRMNPDDALAKKGKVTGRRIRALVAAACHALESGVPDLLPDSIHRLDKADTKAGLVSVRSSAELGVPYSILLYERLLGRPFAGHRDSISELVGNLVENAIEDVLTRAGISFRKTKRAERLPGFDQAPDFVIPNEFNPQVVIEAKLTEDDGTARDKVTRVQHLGTLSMTGQPADQPRFEVIACIAGRGFGERREDMKKLLLATAGQDLYATEPASACAVHTAGGVPLAPSLRLNCIVLEQAAAGCGPDFGALVPNPTTAATIEAAWRGEVLKFGALAEVSAELNLDD